MDILDAVGILALVVSGISLIYSMRTADNAEAAHERTQNNLLESSKADLLALMSDCVAVLNAARVDIGALKAEFDAEPQPVRELLTNYTSLFTEYLPSVETALTTWAADRDAINGWSRQISFSDIMRERARIHESLGTFRNVATQADHLIETFKEKLSAAKEYTAGTAR